MAADSVPVLRRLDTPATGLLVGLLVMAAQVAWFFRAAAEEVGTATTAIVAPLVGGLLLAAFLWTRGARWSAGWIVALSTVWAYLGTQFAAFWPSHF
jgi:hypothetical protein